MGNVIGDSLTKEGAYLAGMIGAFSILGVKATHWPAAGLLGIVMDGVTEVDGAVVAHLDGDSAATIANAAFKATMKNSVPGSGYNFGLDLFLAAADGFPALVVHKALERSPHEVCRLEGDGAPVDGVSGTGAGFAGKGSQYTDYTTPDLYINAGQQSFSHLEEVHPRCMSSPAANADGGILLTAVIARRKKDGKLVVLQTGAGSALALSKKPSSTKILIALSISTLC
ncbi:MAG: hypothetical protein V7609_2092 [Verrucomicrobiota bacterium]